MSSLQSLSAGILIVQMISFFIGTLEALIKNSEKDGNRRLSIPVKAIISFSFIIMTLIYGIGSSGIQKYYYVLTCLGMIAAFFGDLTMGYYFKFNNNIVEGMKIFAVTHFFYIAAYLTIIYNVNKKIVFCNVAGIVIFILLVIAVYSFYLRKRLENNETKKAAVLYGAWIFTMVSTAGIMAFNLGGVWIMPFIGAIMFAISDSLIGYFYILNHPVKGADLWIWVTYVLAQVGILYIGLWSYLI